ncbi:MAG: family 16 glycosylhydrolase [Ghiorsea sp.]|nr:family 16 glycosylhydrolase [Ghiorsea sp.]
MASLDTYTWRISDGWNNGAPFQVGWRSDHVDVYSNPLSTNQLRLTLDNIPCVSNATLCSNQTYAAGEYSSVDLLPFGSVTFTAQAAKASGVITGFFLYTGSSDGQPHDEIDIEFLGNNTTRVQLNYYVNGVGGHEVLLPLGFDASLATHQYTMAWTDTGIDWYVDGALLHHVSGNAQTLPSHTMRIFSNIWATTGVNAWAGAFAYLGVPIYAYVDRIDYDSWANIPAAVNNNAAVETSGGGCMTPAIPPWFIWVFGAAVLLLSWRKQQPACATTTGFK